MGVSRLTNFRGLAMLSWIAKLRVFWRHDLSGLSKDQFARWAERRACRYLKHEGMKVLARNYRTVGGEIDIVATDDGQLVFVEVKAERTLEGCPELKVTAGKRRRLIGTAKAYIRRYNLDDRPARFDIVVIRADRNGQVEIDHARDAFEAT